MYCPNCGTNNDDGVTFCANCGTRLAAAQQEQTTQVVQETAEPFQTPEQSVPQYDNNTQAGHYSYTPQPAAAATASNGTGFAVGSFLCGLFAVFFNCACCFKPTVGAILSIILAIMAIIFACIAKSCAKRMPGLGGSGITLAVIALITAVTLLVIIITLQNAADKVTELLREIKEKVDGMGGPDFGDLSNFLEDLEDYPMILK